MLSCLMLCVATLAAQQKNKQTENQTQTAVSENSVIDTTDETQLPIAGGTADVARRTGSGLSGLWTFIRMILALAVVIFIIWLVFKLMKKGIQPGAENDPFMRKVSSITLSPGKTVQIVTLLDNAYIIGVTDNSVNLIGKVDDKELVDAMNLYADKNENTKKPRNFADILDLFMPGGPRNQKAQEQKQKKPTKVFDGSAEQVVQMLKKQRDRLNKEDKE